MGCSYKIVKIFQSLMFASFSCRFHLPRLHWQIISATKPLDMGYLLFSIVSPWATYCHMADVAQRSPNRWLPFVLPWASYCLVAKGHLLWAVHMKSCQNFSKSDVCLVFMPVSPASLALENYFCHQTLGYWLPIVFYCLTMGYLWIPIFLVVKGLINIFYK